MTRVPNKPSLAAGFTLIEVMIVLAIAGLILLITFEAIPTLTRNGRNNERKQDVATVLQAVSHYELNNSGTFPSTSGFMSNSKLTYYDGTTFQYDATNTQPLPTTGIAVYLEVPNTTDASEQVTNTEVVAVYNARKCSTAGNGRSTNAAAGYNDVVALYALESGNGGYRSLCQQL